MEAKSSPVEGEYLILIRHQKLTDAVIRNLSLPVTFDFDWDKVHF